MARVSDPEQMAEGVTLFNLLDFVDDGEYEDAGPDDAPNTGWIVAVDGAGEVIRGDWLIDEYGRQVASDDSIPVATDSMHHEHGVFPTGTTSCSARNCAPDRVR